MIGHSVKGWARSFEHLYFPDGYEVLQFSFDPFFPVLDDLLVLGLAGEYRDNERYISV
jgi:hypothetical protein